jgi:radical SAM superfamily enzyme YgiQ (UPF0313 family)
MLFLKAQGKHGLVHELRMAKAGCREVSLGFESGSEKILSKMNKKYLAADVRQISERLKSYILVNDQSII